VSARLWGCAARRRLTSRLSARRTSNNVIHEELQELKKLKELDEKHWKETWTKAERDRNRGLHGAVRTLGGAAYSSRAAPTVSAKGHTTGVRARAPTPTRSCTGAKALTEAQPGVRDGVSATRFCMQSKLGTPSRPLFRSSS
jgi:hypothetical protein